MSKVLDASAIVTGWHDYSINLFPKVWDWLEGEVQSGEICIPSVIFKEVEKHSLDCHTWLKANGITIIRRTGADILEAARIKAELGILNDEYHNKGVGENDIILVAMAKNRGLHLLTNEERQVNLPDILKKYKIPAVCQMVNNQIVSYPFLELLKRSGQVF